jgi:multisubunit Na+/H+ antiporter MnhB subunit
VIIRRLAGAIACLALTATLVRAVVLDPRTRVADLPRMVIGALPESGTQHSVTGVLLAFRGYDTMLEIAVLLVAGVVGLALRDRDVPLVDPHALAVSSPLLDALAVRLIAAMFMIAAYLFWAGSYMPGGAFQGGAMIAASGVLLSLTRPDAPRMDDRAIVRVLLSIGFALFLAVAIAGPASGHPILYLRGPQAAAVILAIEALLTVSIAAVLYSLFANAPSLPLLREHDAH